MKLIIDDKEIVYESDKNGRELLLEEIERAADEDARIFSSLLIDGVEYFENYEEMIMSGDIEKVEMVLINASDYARGVLLSIHEYFKSNNDEFDNMVGKLYLSYSEDAAMKISDFIDALGWVVEAVHLIDNNEVFYGGLDREKWNLTVQKVMEIMDVLPEFKSALVNSDNILIADLLKYEVKERTDVICDLLEQILR